MPRTSLKHVAPDLPPTCPGCGRQLALGTPGPEMSASCINDNCRQHVVFARVGTAWKIVERSTLPAISG